MSLARFNTAAAADEGRVLVLVEQGTGAPMINETTGGVVSIRLRGQDSDAFVQEDMRLRNAALDRIASGGKTTAEILERQQAELLAKLVVSWDNIPTCWIDNTDSEEPIKFTHDNAVALFMNRGVKWLREKVDRFVGRRDAFLEPPPKT